MTQRRQRPVQHPAAVNTVRYFLLVAFFVPLAVFAQADPSAPATAEQLRQIMELETQINSLIARRAAQSESAVDVASAQAKRFVIPWDCSQYPASSAAYDNCQAAHKEMALRSPNGAHEASHYINAMCRQMPEYAQGRKGSCIQVGWKDGNPEVIWVDDPVNTSIQGLAGSGCVPGSLRACSQYERYVTDAPNKNQFNLSYLRDEWGAHNIGARKYIAEEVKRGNAVVLRHNLDDALEDSAFFTAMSGSVAEYIKRTNPVAFASPEFRLSLKLQIEDSIAVMREALMARDKMGAYRDFKGVIERGEKTRTLLEQFTHSPQAQIIRTMYGETWFDRTFNIAF